MMTVPVDTNATLTAQGIGDHINGLQESFGTATKSALLNKVQGNSEITRAMDHTLAEKESYYDKFSRSKLDQTVDYPLPVPAISIRQKGEEISFLTLKSFSLWQGKQKSKKTTALVLAVAAFIRGYCEYLETVCFLAAMGGAVLFFDNEQGESYAARTMKLILKIAGVETSPKLIYCDLREFVPRERRGVIEAGIHANPDVRLVIIDGLVDLMDDFMESSEAHHVVTELLKLCSKYNVHIAGVLHQNKNDKNARAHIGAICSQKCEVEISTEVDPEDRDQSLVTCVNSRSLPFEPFAIRWDKGSLPRINQEWNNAQQYSRKANKGFEQHRQFVEAVFKPLSVLTHKESVEGIMLASLKSESTAKRYLTDYQGWGLVVKGTDENYRLGVQEGFTGSSGFKKGS